MKKTYKYNEIREIIEQTKWQTLTEYHKQLLTTRVLMQDIDLIEKIIAQLERMKIDYILLLLGQRRTRTSILDERGLPPKPATLLAAATKPFNEYLSLVGRAYTKHAHRSDYWEKVKGSVNKINKYAINVCREIIEQMEWWNVYEHTKHGMIYEVRDQNGYGVRWKLPDIVFIGFVDAVDPISQSSIID